MQMVKTLVMGAAAAGAAGVAVMTVPDRDGADANGAQARAGEVCLKTDLSLFKDVSAKCFSRDDLLALRDRPVVDRQGGVVELSMSHPTDMSVPPETSRTCSDYREMSFDGWYALSSRDMRREAYFIRACGVLAALLEAQPARSSHFADGSPTAEAVAKLAGSMSFGEANADAANLAVEKASSAVWRISSDAMKIEIHEIANADFDNDGIEEILAFTAGAPEGGTAAFYEAGLIEKDTAGAALSFTPLSYGRNKAAGAGL
ncbi:hypothetical protein [Hyphococcus sp.]|uniref:hypothetical protein n=1 Tax=Hyphococcus sp. TaxID=2038636 RepID=UPI0035C78389